MMRTWSHVSVERAPPPPSFAMLSSALAGMSCLKSGCSSLIFAAHRSSLSAPLASTFEMMASHSCCAATKQG